MTVLRLVAIVVIFFVAAAAWMVLAGSVQYRTDTSDEALGERVEGLWGGPQAQSAPRFTYRGSSKTSRPLPIAGSDITADFKLDQRRKGLLWYATYEVAFDAAYTVRNPDAGPAEVTMEFIHSLGIRIMLAEFSPIPGTPDGDRCRQFTDLSEPLNHNKTAFTTIRLGFDQSNRLKNLQRQLNHTVNS